MPSAQEIQVALARVHDEATFITELLDRTLEWKIPDGVTEIEEITYQWTKDGAKAPKVDEKLVGGRILEVNLTGRDQHWGVFILQFKDPGVFSAERGMTGVLREVLRWLVPSRRKAPHKRSWNRDHLLFICTHDYKQFRFAYFKAPTEAQTQPRLAAFGWESESSEVRTVCEFNLPHLGWPSDPSDKDAWVDQWSEAFNVEKVTKRFYQDYATEDKRLRTLVAPLMKEKSADAEPVKMFVQTLLNRLMFLRFIERKGWLTPPGGGTSKDYLRLLFKAGGYRGKSFYAGRLTKLFFEGLAIEGKQESESIGKVPFLNGGLFEKVPLDSSVEDISDDILKGLLGTDGLLYRYNFTVQESTPLNIEVAVDPEMLGKVFEELVTGRHETGSYYTPRPVVAFMCREALKGYLAASTGLSENHLSAFVDRHETSSIDIPAANRLAAALDDLKAVDPACGSGAYLLGLLHEMVDLYHLLYNDKLKINSRTVHDLKLRTISNSIYGVDIDRFATNIAMLRLWLSLSVDCDLPLPLPNLDFKIETGDSVTGPNPAALPDLFRERLHREADELVKKKGEFLNCHDRTKHAKLVEIQLKQELFGKALESTIGEGVIDWRVHFADVFGKRGGFDIVLANPPYLRNEVIKPRVKARLQELFPDAVAGKSDIYVSFYARALQLLRTGGIHAFICSNSWLDVGYGGKLQKYLLQNSHVLAIYESAVERQFSTADINTIISVLQKTDAGAESPTRFVSFQAPFEDSIADPSRRREVVRTRFQLWETGLRPGAYGRMEYDGDKWGAKYLRAPTIYSVIMEKGAALVANMGQFFAGERYLNTGGADGFFILTDVSRSASNKVRIRNAKAADGNEPFEGDIEQQYVAPLIKDFAKNDKRIEIHGFDAHCLVINGTPSALLRRYIEWGEKQSYHLRSVTKSQRPWYKPTNQMKQGARVLVPRSFNDSFVIHHNPKEFLSLRFYRLHPLQPTHERLVGFMNSTLVAFFVETFGNKSLGQGVLDFFMADFLAMRIPIVTNPDIEIAFTTLKKRPIGSIYEECGLTGLGGTRPTPPADRQAIDNSVFDELGLTAGERDAVYESLAAMVRGRIQKAKSLDRSARKKASSTADDEVE